ncbi:MAG: hypothetical protein AAFN92_16540, partial [Bacteroidota bacterium]
PANRNVVLLYTWAAEVEGEKSKHEIESVSPWSVTSKQFFASFPPPPGVTYRWIHNGTEIGTGTTVDVPSAGCFYVVAEDDCFRAETKPVCIEGCEVGVLILCPVATNGKEFTPCLFPGDQAIFNACGAVSTCGGPLGFEWFVNGDPVPGDGCQIMLTVPDGPFVVSVIATDSNGCRGGDLISISPC